MIAIKAVFEGLVFDEMDRQLTVQYVGDDPCYVLDDDGFQRHISADLIDSQVINAIQSQVEKNKDTITDQTIKMIGDVDIFTLGIIKNQLENLDDQFNHLREHGIPEDGRIYLGMLGLKIVVNYHGDVVRIEQPAAPEDDS